MAELSEHIHEAVEHGHGGSPLGNIVALTVALAATFMAIAGVKDRNITLRMNQAQAKAIDTWNYYQSKSMKQNLAEATLDQMTAVGGAETSLERYKKQVARYDKEKAEVKEEAEGYEKKYEALNAQHDLFDLSDAGMSVAIALLGVTALTKKRWLLAVAFVFVAAGAFFGIAGFMNLSIHPEHLVSWLARGDRASESGRYFNSVMIARSCPSTRVSVWTRSRRLNLVSPGAHLLTTLLPSGVVDFSDPFPR
jgi:hypothetical protein